MIESIIYLLLLSLVPLTSAELIALVLQSSDQFLILPGEQILLEQARALGIDIRGLSAIEETLEGLSQKLSDNLGVSLRRKNKAAVISRDGDALESAPRSVKRPKSSAGKDKQPIPAKIKRAPFSNEYYLTISIGTPPQPIDLIFDTGSSDLFLWQSTPEHVLPGTYDPLGSTSFKNTTIRYENYYADGTGGRGWLGTDELLMGSMIMDELWFGMVDVQNDLTPGAVATGVMGLAQDGLLSYLDHLGEEGGGTLFTRLIERGDIEEKIMGIQLNKSKKKKTDGGLVLGLVEEISNVLDPLGASEHSQERAAGTLMFGGLEGSVIQGGREGMTWIDVTSRYYWGASFDDVAMGKESVSKGLEETPDRYIIDTGTTLIFTSHELATAIHLAIPGSIQDSETEIYYIPCTTAYPEVSNLFWIIGGKKFGVPVADLAWRESEEKDKEGLCVSGIQGGNDRFTVLGDIFIANHYIALAYDDEMKPSIGIGHREDVPPIL